MQLVPGIVSDRDFWRLRPQKIAWLIKSLRPHGSLSKSEYEELYRLID